MKKYIISMFLALAALASVASAETVSLTGGFEGQYVFRGQKITDNVVTATAVASLPSQTELSIAGYWNGNKKDTDVLGEFDVTLSKGFSLDDVTTFTVGGTGYFYPKANRRLAETERTFEAFASLGYEAFLNPTATAGYDFNLKQTFVEGSLSTDVKLDFLLNNLKLAPALSAGFVSGRDVLPEAAGKPVKNSYYYVTGAVDVVYELKNVVLGAGYRYNYLGDSGSRTNSWVGTFVTVRF
jgi:hypothetical protein